MFVYLIRTYIVTYIDVPILNIYVRTYIEYFFRRLFETNMDLEQSPRYLSPPEYFRTSCSGARRARIALNRRLLQQASQASRPSPLPARARRRCGRRRPGPSPVSNGTKWHKQKGRSNCSNTKKKTLRYADSFFSLVEEVDCGKREYISLKEHIKHVPYRCQFVKFS